MSRTILAVFASFVLAACSGGGDTEQAETSPADTLSRAQKDSIISRLPVPGAGAVGRALDAAGTAADRQRTIDSLQRP